ncbi:MAG: hypothetical protein QM606_08515 [Leucobacter sp.]
MDDWQAYADAVVVAHVSGEKAIPAPKSETTEYGGTDLIGREISVEIAKVLWSYPQSERKVSEHITFDAAGWLDDGKASTEVVAGEGSRLEPGHDYVLALKWFPERSDGDETEPAQWGVIGSGGALPADGGIIGVGEYLGVETSEGGVRTAPEGSVLAEHTGRSVDEFTTSIVGFERIEREPVVEEKNG